MESLQITTCRNGQYSLPCGMGWKRKGPTRAVITSPSPMRLATKFTRCCSPKHTQNSVAERKIHYCAAHRAAARGSWDGALLYMASLCMKRALRGLRRYALNKGPVSPPCAASRLSLPTVPQRGSVSAPISPHRFVCRIIFSPILARPVCHLISPSSF